MWYNITCYLNVPLNRMPALLFIEVEQHAKQYIVTKYIQCKQCEVIVR